MNLFEAAFLEEELLKSFIQGKIVNSNTRFAPRYTVYGVASICVLPQNAMPRIRSGWRSKVIVGDQSYVGDGRADCERSMFSAARAALRALGQPSEPNKLSNDQAQADLERYCQARGWPPPKYSYERCRYTPQHSGGGGRRKQSKAVEQRQCYAEVNIGDKRFLGEATYGTEPAKAAAAREALKRMGQSSSLGPSNDPIQALLQFCHSQGLEEPVYYHCFGSSNASMQDSPHNIGGGDSVSTLDNVVKKFQSQEPELGLEVSYDDSGQVGSDWIVGCSVFIGRHTSKQFTGKGRSKPEAKKIAARKAHEWLSMQLWGDVSKYTILSFADVSSGRSAAMDAACQDALRQVCHNLVEPMHDEVFAAILMTRPRCRAEIVSIGCGTGFINHQIPIKNGEAVFDCHAEVLARRGLVEFLFNQIKTAAQHDECILSEIAGKYQVKEGVCFHMFVNKAPCGDACIPWKGKDAGRLHYRKDDGEGNVLHVPPGKENQYKMCCSAKIALWNVVGLQGALLAQLLTHPVYLSTIFVKGAYDGEREGTVCERSLKRAFFGRLQGLKDLPDGYKVNEPTIVVLPSDGGASGGSGSQKHTAFCWAAGSKKEEMIGTASGSHKKGYLDVSRRGFAKIWASFFPRDERKYREVKLAANEYQEAKRKCKAHFNQRGSKWIQRAIDPVPVPSFHDEM